MNDFITISCPSCGGQVRREENTTTYTCDYCGQQHRLRVEDIEEFGRCPICHRNDRVEIVRTVYNKGDNLSTRFAPPQKQEGTLLYQPEPKPNPLQKPAIDRVKSQRSRIAPIIFVISFALLILFVVFVNQYPDRMFQIWYLLVGLGGLVLAVIYFIKGKIEDKKLNFAHQEKMLNEWETQNSEQESRWSTYLEKYDRDFHQQTEEVNSKFAKAVQRYEQLYYCHRDDCVFIPGESGYAPSSKLEEFLFRETNEEMTEH